MVWNSIRGAFILAVNELKTLLRSTKLIVIFIFAIFINIQIVMPLQELSKMMGTKISFLETFIAMGNAPVVALIIPLFFLIIISDYPREGAVQYFFHIRMNRKTWIMAQMIYGIMVSLLVVLAALLISIVLSVGISKIDLKYSEATTHFLKEYPEKNSEYVATLITQRLYNQRPLVSVFWHSIGLSFLNYMLMSFIILFTSVMGKKIVGIVLNILLIVVGYVFSGLSTGSKWILPMTHTLTGTHFNDISRKPVFPMGGSYIYFGALILLLGILIFLFRKKIRAV